MDSAVAPAPLWAPRAWIAGRWRERVLFIAGADGHWRSVQTGIDAPAGATRLQGPVLPGLVNAHSHSFQRAFAGMAEQRDGVQDDFWSWRERMYAIAGRITPAQQQAIAAQLYLELLRGGFTHVCEFHYLHRDTDGNPYAQGALPMAQAIADAAAEAGIGLTLLPAVYERAGFDGSDLRTEQRRFAADAQAVLAMQASLRTQLRAPAIAGNGATPGPALPAIALGLALHSLRAASAQAVARIGAAAQSGPIHIHVAEQTGEVHDCQVATGQRPIDWLCRQGVLDARWQLVHATHACAQEIAAVARSGAGIVLCPTTEANLGDGVCDLPAWLAHAVPLALGTDSHVTRNALEELRLLEYAQRLVRRERNVAADPAGGQASSAGRLWEAVQRGGAAAAGLTAWGLQAGARADLLVVDVQAPALLGVPAQYTLDALVFSSPVRPFRDVMVAGRWVSCDHRNPRGAQIAQEFVRAMEQIWHVTPQAPSG